MFLGRGKIGGSLMETVVKEGMRVGLTGAEKALGNSIHAVK